MPYILTIVARKSYTMGREINDGPPGLLRYIAEGKQAIVYRFGHLLVLKVPLSAWTPAQNEGMQRMIKNLRHPHPNIVPIMCLVSVQDLYGVVMPYIHGHTLHQLIEWCDVGVASMAAKVGLHVLQGLQYLHAHSVLHLDVSPSNIMYNEQSNKFMLIDIDMQRDGTPSYMSPDAALCEQSDSWSTAGVLVYMLTGRPPWHDCTDRVQILALLFTQRRPPELVQVPSVWLGPLSSMMQCRALERPTACEIISGTSDDGKAVMNVLLNEYQEACLTQNMAAHADSISSGTLDSSP